MNEKTLLKGNIAIAKAAVNCGCKCYFGYPITPQTDIGEYLSLEMQKRGLGYVCAESEVAAINMAIGGACTGAKVMTSSSSCAVSLMQEGISYASSDELPIVIINVMRAGPGQGYIYPSQGDYDQAVTGGGNGDYRTIVLAPSNVQECIDLTYRAFYLAQKYKNPTILLVDGVLGQMAEPAELIDSPYEEIDNSNWKLDGAKNRPCREIHSLEPDQNKLNAHIKKMYEKYKEIENNEVDFEEYKCEDAEIILTAFGTMARCAKAVCDHYREKGIKIGVFRPITLFPFPTKKLQELSKNTKLFIDIEMNMGQMYKDVKLAVTKNSEIDFIGKPVGNWLKKEELIKIIDEKIKEHNNASI